MKLTHVDENGRANMVDVSKKSVTLRRARARSTIYLLQATLQIIAQHGLPKGDAFAAARIAGIMAAKRCDELIPLCHSLPLESVSVDLEPHSDPPRVEITSEVICTAKTGAEMEALMAVSVAALTIYDMVKSVDREARIGDIRLIEKSGGKSGHFVREEGACLEE
jgi:cyclic pyranopterin monophosphate synthase